MSLSVSDVAQFRLGDEIIFKKVYEAYKPKIYAMSYRLLQRRSEAEDVTAETFLVLWLVRGQVKEASHIEPFLYITARNKCLNILRKRKSAPHISIGISGQPEAVDCLYEEIDYLITIKALAIAIEQLPAQQKEVIRLNFIQGLPIKEVAGIMNIGVKSAYTHRARAIALLLKLLDNKGLELFMAILLIGICGIFLKIMLEM